MEEENGRRLYMLSFWRKHWLNCTERIAVNKKGSLLSHLHCWLVILRHTSVSMVTEQGLETWRIKALGNLEMKRENMKIRAEFFVTAENSKGWISPMSKHIAIKCHAEAKK
jgi:hypothetical protein